MTDHAGTTGRLDDATSGRVVDVRGPRFGAAVTTVVLASAIVIQGTVGLALLTWQLVAFGVGATAGPSRSPYGRLFRVVRAALDMGPPPATEPEGPPRFAQLCGLVVGGLGLAALIAGATTLGWILVGIVLALSTLLASTGLCVGCELYLLVARLRRGRTTAG